MPGNYKPNVEFFAEGIVSVRSVDNTSYQEIEQSLGSTIYACEKVYVKTQTREQLLQPIYFQKYDANGNKQAFSEIIVIDPNQKQNSLDIPLEKHNVVFDGQATPSVVILPLQTVNMYFFVKASSPSIDFLRENTMFTEQDFFKNFNDRIGYEL